MLSPDSDANNRKGRRLSVAMLTPQWIGTVGGPTTYVAKLSDELRLQGKVVNVLTPFGGEGAIAIGNRAGLKTICLFRKLLRAKPDIVHIHGRLHMIPAAVCYRKVATHAVKVIFTFHTQPSLRNYITGEKLKRSTYYGFTGKIGTILLNQCDRITSVSGSIIENINAETDLRVTKSTIIIPSGADDALFLASVSRAPSSNSLVLTSVGVMVYDWKYIGHKICIDAVSELRKNGLNAKLNIVGDGPYRNKLEQHSRALGLGDAVRFLGNRTDVSEVLKQCGLYVHMAPNEGCSLAIIEAMMAGKVVIASRTGGNPEIISDGLSGILVEPTAKALAQAVCRIVDNPSIYESLGRTASVLARQRFAWSVIAEQYSKSYEA